MNKTININLGGVFFHIDEDAYKKLKKYLDAIRKSLSDDPQGKDEIITDIETRIGEILAEKIKDVRQVVNEQDIANIIIVMGKPEEYAGDDEFFGDETHRKSTRKRKKLFRDTEDKFLGGVSSGLSHYFGIDVIWIRLAWLVLLFGGFSVILYPILWILLPQAHSTSEKLEMEGEDVNISNIERKIKEGFNEASQLLKDGIDDASEKIKRGDYQFKVKSGLQEIIDLFSKVFAAIFKVAGKFIGILLIITSVLTLLAILISGFSLGSIEFLGLTDELAKYPPFFYTSRIPSTLLAVFSFIVVAIPFVLLFKLGLKIISSNVNSFTRATNLSLLGVWLLAIMGLSFAGIEYGAHSSNKFSKSDRFTLENVNILDTLNIKMIALEEFSPRRYSEDKTVFINDTEKAYRTNIQLDIRESNTDELFLKVHKKANSISLEKAKELANEIDYKFKVVNENLLLDAYFLANMDNIHHSQYIRITLFVPKGMIIYLDKSTKYFLNDIDNYQNIYDRNMIKHFYAMDDEGLDCLDCDNKKAKKVKRAIVKQKNKETTKVEKTVKNPNKEVKTNKATTNLLRDTENINKEVNQKTEN